jgi:hypothetical protein
MIAAAEHHQILLENDRVRVLDSQPGPGESTSVHTHPRRVIFVLSWSDVIRCGFDGNVLLDSRTLGARPAKGAALWSAVLGPHFARNVGTEELRIIAVDMKEPRTA